MAVRMALAQAQRGGALSLCGSSRRLLSSTATKPTVEPNTNLFVSGLNDNTTTKDLKEAFSNFGTIRHARVWTDDLHEHSLGFGFVRYATLEEAAEGIKAMDGKVLDGYFISVEYARPKTPTELRSNVVPWRWTKDLWSVL